MVKLYHKKNEISIDLSGVQNPTCIEFYYTGKMYGESQLLSDWIMMLNNRRVICFSISGTSTPELLLNYAGLINIKGGTVIDRNLKLHPMSIVVQDIDYWENINSEYDKNTQNWENFDNKHEKVNNIQYSSIVKNNLTANDSEFYYFDGSSYNGEYHLHGDGQAMTGSEHSNDSVFIFRKNKNGKIYNVREKMDPVKKRALKAPKPTIPTPHRKFTQDYIVEGVRPIDTSGKRKFSKVVSRKSLGIKKY